MKPTLTVKFYAPQTAPEPQHFPYRVAEVAFQPTNSAAWVRHTITIGLYFDGARFDFSERAIGGFHIWIDQDQMTEEPIENFPEAVTRAWAALTDQMLPPILKRYLLHYARSVGYARAFATPGEMGENEHDAN